MKIGNFRLENEGILKKERNAFALGHLRNPERIVSTLLYLTMQKCEALFLRAPY